MEWARCDRDCCKSKSRRLTGPHTEVAPSDIVLCNGTKGERCGHAILDGQVSYRCDKCDLDFCKTCAARLIDYERVGRSRTRAQTGPPAAPPLVVEDEEDEEDDEDEEDGGRDGICMRCLAREPDWTRKAACAAAIRRTAVYQSVANHVDPRPRMKRPDLPPFKIK